jgi:hypothetical protein
MKLINDKETAETYYARSSVGKGKKSYGILFNRVQNELCKARNHNKAEKSMEAEGNYINYYLDTNLKNLQLRL